MRDDDMHTKANKEDVGLVSNLPLNIRSQYKKTYHYFQTTKTKCGITLSIFALVICITFIFYSSLSTNAEIRLLEKSRVNNNIPEKVQNTTVNVPEKVQNNVTEKVVQNNVPVKAQDTVPKKAEKRPLYFFGDSLFDTGQGFFVGLGNVADSYPYGTTYFKRPVGRYSDGLLIPDLLAQYADMPLPQPYGNPFLVDYTRTVNFAGTSAGVLVDGRNYSINLNWQTDFFVEMTGKMRKQYGKQKTKKLLSNAVLVFHIGSNDYTDIWVQNPRPLNSTFVNYFVNKMLGNFTTVVTRMYNEGARKFAFLSQGPMGCIPLLIRLPDGECQAGLNDIVKRHNAGFDALLKTWSRQLPGIKYTLYDFYSAIISRKNNGPKYGFKETKAACCGSGLFNSEFTCMDNGNFTLCDDIPSHLFFDPVHPTQQANMQYAQELWEGPPNVIKPFNIKHLLYNE